MPVTAEPKSAASSHKPFQRFAWGVLAFNMLVVLWGSYVRASGSGAGCGSHWPLCNGVVVPTAPSAATIIEFTHRATSGLALLLAAALVVWSFRDFPRGHGVRRFASFSMLFLCAEALLGAGLVLLRYVARDASAGRALYLSAHLINTQLLLGFLAATAWFAGPSAKPGGRRPLFLNAALLVALAAGVTGAIAALGDTLYPASSLTAGVASELAGAAPVLLRLRMLHPAVALIAAVYLLFAARGRAGGQLLIACILIQFAAGILNWILLAPVWMQIVHLLLADLLWIALVLVYLKARPMTYAR
jgi:cytochrome c oxidase assembly protein subunit 15